MNAGDPEQVKKAKERDEREARRHIADVRTLMALPAGRRVFQHYIEFCKPLEEPFSTNGSVTNYNLGRSSAGRKIYADLDEASPELFLKMKQERREDLKNA